MCCLSIFNYYCQCMSMPCSKHYVSDNQPPSTRNWVEGCMISWSDNFITRTACQHLCASIMSNKKSRKHMSKLKQRIMKPPKFDMKHQQVMISLFTPFSTSPFSVSMSVADSLIRGHKSHLGASTSKWENVYNNKTSTEEPDVCTEHRIMYLHNLIAFSEHCARTYATCTLLNVQYINDEKHPPWSVCAFHF